MNMIITSIRKHVSLCCWRICLLCLSLELVGPCVVLGFSVGMEAFDELLSWCNAF